ncbi:beta-1,3-galactosyltransferase 1-like [Anguilla anguilla]|uniref:beta-1,3-galactosyltransferase 1-like n=1 Tax=Anguilla anguilla TaxID=7936 RepID=UPI0015A78A93|nr:beta-1,3-galactosyltransferase 1-like [Anguilla anguilla]
MLLCVGLLLMSYVSSDPWCATVQGRAWWCWRVGEGMASASSFSYWSNTACTTPNTTRTAPNTTRATPNATHTAPNTTRTTPNTTCTAPNTTHATPTTRTTPNITRATPNTTRTELNTTRTTPNTITPLMGAVPHLTQPIPWKPPGPFEVAYPHLYHFILDQPDKCQGLDPFLVLMVPVAPWNREARDAVRATWGNQSLVSGVTIRRLFILGLADRTGLQEELFRESSEHHDLLQGDFLDSYRNLTIKTMLMMEWLVAHCPNAAYAAKVDTDMFLNMKLLIRLLDPHASRPKHNYITGAIITGGVVRRDKGSRWYMPPEVYPNPTYPLYISGNAYAFSMDLPGKILEASRVVKPIYLEDVYLGMCLEHLGLEPTPLPDPGLFHLWPLPYSRCHYTNIVSVTGMKPHQLLLYWADFHKAGPPCPHNPQTPP